MNAAEKYARALYPDTYRVLGRRMADYTLGHALLLERLGSPFVIGDALPGPGDVKLFLLLCSRRYPRALRLVQLSQLLPTWFAWRLRCVRLPLDQFPYAVVSVNRYLQESSSMPKPWKEEGAKKPGSPPLQQVKLTLMSRLGYSRRQALCTHLAEAFWDFFGLWELEGKISLTDDDRLADARRVIQEARAEHDAMNGARRPTTGN